METDGAAACRYFTPGDACRLALAAYRAAGQNLTPPDGRWIVDGEPWATGTDFADWFMDELAARLGLLALERIGTFHPPGGNGDVYVLAELAAPERMRRIIADRDADLASFRETLGTTETHGLRTADNAVHNAEQEGVR